jgi:hypothetical protein
MAGRERLRGEACSGTAGGTEDGEFHDPGLPVMVRVVVVLR